jgi:hypothetical protein
LRTEEKKREKERPSATSVTPTVPFPDDTSVKQDEPQVADSQAQSEKTHAETDEKNLPQPHADEAQNSEESHDAVIVQAPASAEDKVG